MIINHEADITPAVLAKSSDPRFVEVYSNDDPNLDTDVQCGVTRSLVGPA